MNIIGGIIMAKQIKLLLLAKVLLRSPREFVDRMEAILTSRYERYFPHRPEYKLVTAQDTMQRLCELFGDVDWSGVEEIERAVKEKMQALEKVAPFTTKHHGDFSLARTCFAVCRLLKPEIVVETGVAYGVTSAFILAALHLNGKGDLHSVDLPPLGENADTFVGYLVPNHLRDRWVLHRGISKRVLSNLLPKLGRVDVFVHDSLHTYWNIKRELNIVTPYLSRPSVVIADDIHGNKAFLEWVTKVGSKEWLVFKEQNKESIAGVAVFV